MLVLQEEEKARGGAADIVADLSEAIKVAEASSPAGTVNGAGSAVEQVPAFSEEAGSAVQAAGGSPDEVPMAAAAAASMGAAPVEVPAEPAAAGGSGGACADVSAATGSAAGPTVGWLASLCCIGQQVWRCLLCVQLHVGCPYSAAAWHHGCAQCCWWGLLRRQLRLRLGWHWRQSMSGTIRQMSGEMAATLSCHISGPALWGSAC